jgi:peroxiredoxin
MFNKTMLLFKKVLNSLPMKTFYSIFPALLFFSLLSSSSYGQQSVPGFLINGHIDGVKDSTKVMLIDIFGQRVIDSAVTSRGNFKIKGHTQRPILCWIMCMDQYANVCLENVHISFNASLKNMNLNYSCTAGKEQAIQNQINHETRELDFMVLNARDSLINKVYKNKEEENKLKNEIKDAQDKASVIYIKMAKLNYNSFLGLSLLYMNRSKILTDTLKLLVNKLKEPYKSSEQAKILRLYFSKTKAQVGQAMIDFEAKTITGKTFRLSSLKGKYIYLTFGSAGCAPCRTENQVISKNFHQYQKNIAFVYFSLDVNKEAWQTVTKADGISWYNVSDMKGATGPTKTIYDVQAMPTSFLINKEGTIMERFEGYNTAIVYKFSELAK